MKYIPYDQSFESYRHYNKAKCVTDSLFNESNNCLINVI